VTPAPEMKPGRPFHSYTPARESIPFVRIASLPRAKPSASI
jgi:hypothetical protein